MDQPIGSQRNGESGRMRVVVWWKICLIYLHLSLSITGHESTHEISEEWEEWEDESASGVEALLQRSTPVFIPDPQSTNKISEEWEEWEDRSTSGV